MDMVVCLVCDSEPFACPEKYRLTHMKMHLETAHQLVNARLTLQSRREISLYSIGRGRRAEPILKKVEVAVETLTGGSQ